VLIGSDVGFVKQGKAYVVEAFHQAVTLEVVNRK
jgi:hypothetical protein